MISLTVHCLFQVGKTILRLKTNILKTLIKKKKKKKEDQAESTSEPDLKIWMSIKGACVDDDKTPVHQVFVKGAVLHIEDQNYPVEVNLPTILALILPKNIMVGFPIYPKIQVEFCDLQDCSFVWYKEKIVDEPSKRAKTTVLCVKVGDTFSYTPLLSDLGHKLKVTCVPKLGERCGGEFSVLSKCDVEAGPGLCPFENRHMYTQNVLDDHG
jgi:2',5'-phosphodiesterase